MRIAIYTLTRDRLEYTRECFERLKDFAGKDYDHFVVDNGSTDGTTNWLKENEGKFKKVIFNKENMGISVGSNQALEEIFRLNYDLIIKMDNDCYVLDERILEKIEYVYQSFGKFAGKFVLSPRVEGINNQPARLQKRKYGHYNIGLTGIVGGLFHIVPWEVYRDYRYDVKLPKAKYQDDFFCKWVLENGGNVGYIEDLCVEHKDGTDNQPKKFPEYYKRKYEEENI